MSHTPSIKLWGRGSLRRNFKKAFSDSGLSGSVVLFMVICVITPTIILQSGFTVIAGWEVLLTALLYLSLRMTSEEE
jgi:hypothetical protein